MGYPITRVQWMMVNKGLVHKELVIYIYIYTCLTDCVPGNRADPSHTCSNSSGYVELLLVSKRHVRTLICESPTDVQFGRKNTNRNWEKVDYEMSVLSRVEARW